MASYEDDHGIDLLAGAREAATQMRAGMAAAPQPEVSDTDAPFRQLLSILETLGLGGFGQDSEDGANPPASKRWLEEQDLVFPTDEEVAARVQCPVCMLPFEPDDQLQALPCDHIFHPECIVPWLAKRNTCPMCREEVPTDDQAYEAAKRDKARAQDREAELEQLHADMFG